MSFPNRTSSETRPNADYPSTKSPLGESTRVEERTNSGEKNNPAMRQRTPRNQLTWDDQQPSPRNSSSAAADNPQAQSSPKDTELNSADLEKLSSHAHDRRINSAGSDLVNTAAPNSSESHSHDQQPSNTIRLSTRVGSTKSSASASTTPPLTIKKSAETAQLKTLDQCSDQILKVFAQIPEIGDFGEWSLLHILATQNDPAAVSTLIASGKSLDAMTSDGHTVLHLAIHNKNERIVKLMLKAGANPMACKEKSKSPLRKALDEWPEIVETLTAAIRPSTNANPDEKGNTEIHAAVNYPKTLRALLSAGLRDCPNNQGTTALMLASNRGMQKSVKYLLAHPPSRVIGSDARDYINLRTIEFGVTALSYACDKNYGEIAQLLLKHGASLDLPPDIPSLLSLAMRSKNIRLAKNLLASGASEFEGNLFHLLCDTVESGWVDGFKTLYPFVKVPQKKQNNLLTHWRKNPQIPMLMALDAKINDKPKLQNFLDKENFLATPFQQKNPDLLKAMLKFVEGRDCFRFALRSFIEHAIEDHTSTKNPAMGQILIEYAQTNLDSFYLDEKMIRHFFQLSDQLKNYSFVTEIQARQSLMSFISLKTISFDKNWISDPVSRELLGILGEKNAKEESSNIFSKFSTNITSTFTKASLDGAQLSNDLIFALKSTDVGKALDEVFDTHQLSAILRQALKPVLQGLITQLYPGTTTRPDAVCRFLIAYAFSTLEDNPRFNQHPAFKLLQSDPQWAKMRQKVQSEIEVLENVASTVLDTMVSVQLWETLPTEALRLTVESLKQVDPANYLAEQFRLLGALDIPAHRLAQACVNALRRWREQGGIIPSSGHLPLSTQLQLKALIGNELAALKQTASLPDYLTSNALSVETDLNPEFHAMLWWQWDLMHRAFGIDNAENLARPAERIQNPAPEKHAKES